MEDFPFRKGNTSTVLFDPNKLDASISEYVDRALAAEEGKAVFEVPGAKEFFAEYLKRIVWSLRVSPFPNHLLISASPSELEPARRFAQSFLLAVDDYLTCAKNNRPNLLPASWYLNLLDESAFLNLRNPSIFRRMIRENVDYQFILVDKYAGQNLNALDDILNSDTRGHGGFSVCIVTSDDEEKRINAHTRSGSHLPLHLLCSRLRYTQFDTQRIYDEFCAQAGRDGFSVTDGFREALRLYIEAVYPDAVCSGEAFLRELMFRISSVRASHLHVEKILTEEDVPFSPQAVRQLPPPEPEEAPSAPQEKQPGTADREDPSRLLRFVVGMNEFAHSGRIEPLEPYLDCEENEALIRPLKEIAESIRWNSVSGFRHGLQALTQYFESDAPTDNAYLAMFRDQVKTDYQTLLNDPSVLDIIRWCYRKEFYRMAVAFAEADIYRLFEQYYRLTAEGIMYMERTNTEFERKDDHDVFNTMIKNYLFEKYRTVLKTMRSEDLSDFFSQKQSMERIANKFISVLSCGNPYYDYEADLATATKLSFRGVIGSAENAIRFTETDPNKRRKLAIFLFLHKFIQNLRNMPNHAWNDEQAFDPTTLKGILDYYIRLAAELTE